MMMIKIFDDVQNSISNRISGTENKSEPMRCHVTCLDKTPQARKDGRHSSMLCTPVIGQVASMCLKCCCILFGEARHFGAKRNRVTKKWQVRNENMRDQDETRTGWTCLANTQGTR